AAEPALVRKAALGRVAALELARRREVVGRRHDPVLRMLALRDLDLAAAADAAAATDRIEVDAEPSRRVEHGRPGLEAPSPAGGGEDPEGVAHVAAALRRPSRPPRRPRVASPADSPHRAIQSAQCASCPMSTSAAFTALSISVCKGLVIADVSPEAIAIGRKAAFSAGRFGNPKLTFEAPHVELTPSSSRRRRRILKTCCPAFPSRPIGMTSGSTTTSSFGMP